MNIAKNLPQPGQENLDTGVCIIPHADKAGKGGEDAMFATPNIVGLADGVGGWITEGLPVLRFVTKLRCD